jgi:hypothetical protein
MLATINVLNAGPEMLSIVGGTGNNCSINLTYYYPSRDKFNVTSVSRHRFSVASSTPRLWDELYIDIDRALARAIMRSIRLWLVQGVCH